MCGLFGAINLNSFFTNDAYGKFLNLTEIVSHRGPDSDGYLGYNSGNSKIDYDKFNVFLGHKRLSIIELSKEGSQPLLVDGIYIIFNGEIFNYIELKKNLLADCIFRTKTDTEVIIRIYQKYGVEGFRHLNGMWSFILLDTNKNNVIICRDRFSIKPLYIYSENNIYYFASEIKQLLPLLPKKEINTGVMFKFLHQGLVDISDLTFFSGIKQFLPRTCMIVNLVSREIITKEYWDFTISEKSSDEGSFDEFKTIFEDSVKIRLRSDVKIGALLSGGLDSSAISVIADKYSNNNFDTYSVVSHNKKFSEEKFIDILIKEKNIRNHKLFLEPEQLLTDFENVIKVQDEPFGSFSIVAQYSILKQIKNNSDVKVVLSGQGGDELLAGYLKFFFFYLNNLLKEKNYSVLLKEILFSLYQRTALTQFKFNLGKRYIKFSQKKANPYLVITGAMENIWECNNLSERQKLDIEYYSVPNLNRYEDRNSMAHSLETRTPFLDHRLVDFCLSLNDRSKIKNGWLKYCLRKSINELPESIRWRRDKRNFLIPEDKWIRNDLKDSIVNSFKDSMLHKHGIINKDNFISYYQSFLNGNRSIHYSDISRVYIAELWAKRNFVEN